MSQSIQLSVSGLYTAPSDYAGLPPGALSNAVNVESRHKNILESRRGFDAVSGTESATADIVKMTNFPVTGVEANIILNSDGELKYHHPGDGSLSNLTGYVTGYVQPDDLARNRFVKGNQNLYITDRAGVFSLSSGSGSLVLPAGIPRGLDLTATTTGTSGFLTNNTVRATTVKITSGSPTLTKIANSVSVAVGQYVSGTGIPAATTVQSINSQTIAVVTPGTTTVGGTTISFVANPSSVAGQILAGVGIQDGTKVVSQAGAGPFVVTVDTATYQAGTPSITFYNPLTITMSANASATTDPLSVVFSTGSQVAYRALFGRVETDIDGNTTTRYGAPSAMAIATNTSGTSVDCSVVVTLPKNSSSTIGFIQLYRSDASAGSTIEPLDQMQLVYERDLVAGDFTARSVTITDSVTDSTKGIPLYTGTDREGILQANLPPPSCWDMEVYRNFALYLNATQPSTLAVTLTAVGGGSGIAVNDTITIVAGSSTEVYTAKAAETASAREFKVFTTGTASQNITDTVNSLIRVINYDNSLPVHAILTSTSTDLPGQITLEADVPYGTFTATASAHASAWDPVMTNLASEVNNYANGLFVSKSDELESVPGANLYRVGDSSSPAIRVIALRDYALVLKTDGIYKVLGTDPRNLTVIPFDLTTNIIGPDTAVRLNSGVWMLSNQGVVSIDDSGVSAKSPPIDNQINELIGTNTDGLNDLAFGIGYETDRKYILSVPEAPGSTVTTLQYLYNYVTNSWTNWDRSLAAAYVNTNQNKLYIGRGDGALNGISKERRAGTYTDYSDESMSLTISSVTSTTQVVLNSVLNVSIGDILYKSGALLSPITAVDSGTNTVTTLYEVAWTTGAVTILKAINNVVTFKQVFGDNPAFVRQFAEGLALFKTSGFNSALLGFSTDFSGSVESVTLTSSLLSGLWGLFPWGDGVWSGAPNPTSIRFLVPANKQLGSYIVPKLTINQAWSAWKFQGMSLSWEAVSGEVGR